MFKCLALAWFSQRPLLAAPVSKKGGNQPFELVPPLRNLCLFSPAWQPEAASLLPLNCLQQRLCDRFRSKAGRPDQPENEWA